MPDWTQYVRQNLHLQNFRPESEAEIVDDLAQQLEDAYRDALSRGLSETKAGAFACEHISDWKALARNLSQSRAGALDALDRLQRSLDDSRARGGWRSRFSRLPQDLLFALRMMRKNPVFTAIAVLTLALGIGGNTAIFSVLNVLLFHSAPVQDPGALVSLRWSTHAKPKIRNHSSYGDCQTQWTKTTGATSSCSFSLPFFRALQQQSTSPFGGLAGFAGAPRLDVSGNGAASIVSGQLISGDYFPTLGIQAAAGRLIAPSDDTSKSANVVVLSYAYWQSTFGGSPSAVGKAIRINSVPFTIIGVVEQRFKSLSVSTPWDVWLPLSANPQLIPNYDPRQAEADSFWVEIVARLRNGIPHKQSEAEVSLNFRNAVIHGEKPISKEADQPSVELIPLPQALGPAPDKLQPVYVLMLAVGLILLIACANVAGLMLARATARRKEIAVRIAVGAARADIVRQLLTESVLLSALGGSCGVLFAVWALHAITSMISNGGEMRMPFTPTIDLRVLGFTAAVSIVTGIIFGMVPALRATRVDLNTAMKENDGVAGMAGERRRCFSFGNVLVGVQVSLAIVLLIGAGLLVRTLRNLQRVNPGFNTRNLLMFAVDARLAGYKDTQVDDLYRNLLQRLAAIPGVRQVTYSWRPLLRGSLWTHDVHIPGTPADTRVEVDYMAVGPDFFGTMGIPILVGHEFTESEFASARTIALQVEQHRQDPPPTQPMPVIVNRAFANQYFKERDALGQQFGYENEPERKNFGYEVVGMVADAKYNNLRRDIKPTLYVPSAVDAVYFELRTALDAESLISSVRSTVASVDSALPVFDIKTQKQQIDEQLVTERTLARLSGFFGVLALLLASIGLYGLLAYDVAQRTREVGLRMALGARQSDVIAAILKRGLALAAVGALAGAALGLALVRLARTLLFGVGVIDAGTLVSVTGLLLVVALAACTLPAWRAATVDPMISLRCE